MTEIELKFQIPPDRRAAVGRAVATPRSTVQLMQAAYFDTPDRRLASARIALRVRREGRRWVQTLKTEGSGVHERQEHEVPVPAPSRGAAPQADIALHAGSAAGLALRAALGDAAHTLQLAYQTRIRRTERPVRVGASVVVVTLDIGEIRAANRRLPVHELEFELARGKVTELIELCRRWTRRFDLWLDVRSKSERGDRLARDVLQGEARHASPLRIDRRTTPQAALRGMVSNALGHALPNMADVADGIGAPEQLHQARVALRRLRVALRVFGAWSPGVDPAWSAGLASLFGALGAARERDALAGAIWPALREAGAPLVELSPPSRAMAPEQALTNPDTTLLLLDLLAFSVAGEQPAGPAEQRAGPCATDGDAPATPADLGASVAPLMKRLHRRLTRDAAAFPLLDDTARHEVRKRLKRLRYSIDFLAPLYSDRPSKRYLQTLRLAQEALGEFNDLSVAEDLYRQAAIADGRAWFAVGWLVARKAAAARRAAHHLSRLARLRPIGRRRR